MDIYVDVGGILDKVSAELSERRFLCHARMIFLCLHGNILGRYRVFTCEGVHTMRNASRLLSGPGAAGGSNAVSNRRIIVRPSFRLLEGEQRNVRSCRLDEWKNNSANDPPINEGLIRNDRINMLHVENRKAADIGRGFDLGKVLSWPRGSLFAPIVSSPTIASPCCPPALTSSLPGLPAAFDLRTPVRQK